MRVETSYVLVGELIGVDTVVVGPTGRAKVLLILDTGATLTTVVPKVAESIGYSSALRVSWMIARTAAAEEHGYVVRSEVTALGFTVPLQRMVVAELGYGIDGVLGIDFLSLFNFEIRPAERRILLEKLAP